MIKKTLTYDNFDGGQDTKDFYFHLGKGDLISMMLESGFEENTNFALYLQQLATGGDTKAMINKFKEIIGLSYGVRTEGGGFRKSPEITEDFITSPAFDELFYQICTDDKAAAEFVNGLIPKDMVDAAQGTSISNELAQRMAAATNVPLPTTPSVIALKPEAVVNDVPAAFQKRPDGHNLLGAELDPDKKLEDYTQVELLNLPSHQFQQLMERSKNQ